jgi:hypothetical protein
VNALAGSLCGMGNCQPHSQRAQTSFLLGFFPPYGKKLGDLDFPASALRENFNKGQNKEGRHIPALFFVGAMVQ